MSVTSLGNSTRELLENPHFRKRIQMFIGVKEISHLHQFLNGINMAKWIYNIDIEEDDFINIDFHEEVRIFYKLPVSSLGWKSMILEEVGGDEEKAVDEFFRVYDLIKNTDNA